LKYSTEKLNKFYFKTNVDKTTIICYTYYVSERFINKKWKVICMKAVIKQNFIGVINEVEFNDQGTFEMVEDFIKDIEYANNIEIKTEKATDFIRNELIEKANKIFDRKMETYEEAVNEAKEELMDNKNFIEDIKKLN
jgi:hypothetical protein